jgi:hypothetical protein
MIAEAQQLPDPDDLARHLIRVFTPTTIEHLLATDHKKYQKDPVGFGEQVLGEAYTDDVKLMMESVRDNVITIAKSSNATGKSHGAARVAVWFYKSFPGAQVYTAAAPPEDNLRRILWGEIGSIVQRHPELFEDDKKTDLELKRSSLEFLAGVRIPSSGTPAEREGKFSGKHAPYILFIVDEGDACPDEVYKGIESCMTGGQIVRLLVMFNPRAASGAPYIMERDGLANVVPLSAFRHPNVVTGNEIIPGAVNRETTVRRINQWTRPMKIGDTASPESIFELPRYLEGCVGISQSGAEYPPLVDGRYVIKNPAFSYMVLGRYPAQGDNQLISREWIAMARGRWDYHVERFGEDPPDALPIMGVDVADKGMDHNVIAVRYGGYLCRFETWQGIDIISTGDRVATEYHRRRCVSAYIDATGVGAGVAPYMRRLNCIGAYGVMVANRPTEESELGQFAQMRDQLWWACREWLRTDPYAAIPPDEQLIEELTTPTYEIKNGKIKIMSRDDIKSLIQRSPDRASALCMTFATGMVDIPQSTGRRVVIEDSGYYHG